MVGRHILGSRGFWAFYTTLSSSGFYIFFTFNVFYVRNRAGTLSHEDRIEWLENNTPNCGVEATGGSSGLDGPLILSSSEA